MDTTLKRIPASIQDFKKLGQKVGVWVDDIDKALVNTMDNPLIDGELRTFFKGFYGLLRGMDYAAEVKKRYNGYLFAKKVAYCIIFSFFIIACSRYPSEVEKALRFAGDNRIELETVLEQYRKWPEDALKYRAACFLIENMRFTYSFQSSEIERFYQDADSIFSEPRIHDQYENRLDTVLLKIRMGNVKQIPDLQVITAQELIAHIDCAFEVMTFTWYQNLSFDEFCEYILPYHIGEARLESWMPLYREHFSPIVNKLKDSNMPDSVFLQQMESFIKLKSTDANYIAYIDSLIKARSLDLLICAVLSKEFWTVIHYPKRFKPNPLPTSFLKAKVKVATCPEWTQLGLYAMRSFGIPTVCDFSPNWANRSGGHEWSSLLLPGGREMPFLMGDGYLGYHEDWFGVLAKVYRRTAKIQTGCLAFQGFKEAIPPLFKNPYYIDVSSLYFKPIDVQVELSLAPPQNKQLAYIMVFNNRDWSPVHWGKIKNNKVVFNAMNQGCVYLAMYFHEGSYYPASLPFYIKDDGTAHYLKADIQKKEPVCLIRKYTDKKVMHWCARMVGGSFQLANRADFADAVTIHEIDSIPEAMFLTVSVETEGSYQYFRYVASPTSPGDMAELEIYNNEGIRLEGEIIGNNSSLYVLGLSDKYKAFDGDVLTFFEAEKREDVWIGMKFSQKEKIGKFVYLPRNDDNFIREGELYELFFWGNEGKWISLGQQHGEKAKQALYYDAPRNALLRLRNLSKGVEERIFTYESGKQVWW